MEKPQLKGSHELKVRSAGFLALLFLGFVLLKAPFLGPALDSFCLMLAKITAGLLSLVDPEVQREGNVYYRGNWGSAIAVTKECGAFTFSLAFACAVTVIKFPLWRKVSFLFLGLLAIQVVNVIRLAGLMYGRALLPAEAFDTLHYQIFPLMFCLFSLALVAVFVCAQWGRSFGGAFSAQR